MFLYLSVTQATNTCQEMRGLLFPHRGSKASSCCQDTLLCLGYNTSICYAPLQNRCATWRGLLKPCLLNTSRIIENTLAENCSVNCWEWLCCHWLQLLITADRQSPGRHHEKSVSPTPAPLHHSMTAPRLLPVYQQGINSWLNNKLIK